MCCLQDKCAENIEEGTLQPPRCRCANLAVFNWLEDIPDVGTSSQVVEVRFKNTRKAYFLNYTGTALLRGDIVAVEASPGHDVGIVSLSGEIVALQIRHLKIEVDTLKKVYRKVKSTDIEKWLQAVEKEKELLKRSRQIVSALNLDMKISDVEVQGDKTKATFYYTSEERVDFRQLIKEFADNFKMRIEMKQIGARQES